MYIVQRIGCYIRYVIDIGCGAGYKTTLFTPEFIAIGVDYSSNVEKGRKRNPNVQYVEVNLDVSIFLLFLC